MTKRILLIDGDLLAYKIASACEQAIEWPEGFWTWQCNFDEVRDGIEFQLSQFMGELDGDEMRIALTDATNWRTAVLPTYKGNRSGVKKPLVLKPIREWLIDEKGAIVRPGLEGDDVLGIFATWDAIRGEKVIVSLDKDMKTIPGLYCRDIKSGIVEVTEEEADYWHMFQTLTGDQTDGYAGCPGVGKATAERVLRESIALRPIEHTLKRGPRKGQTETRWEEEKAFDAWDTVISHYRAAGLTEADALQQARAARILRASDYDFTKKEPILWTPKF